MRDYRVGVEVTEDGSVTIKGLPLQPGDRVEVIIGGRGCDAAREQPYPLRGKPVKYIAGGSGRAMSFMSETDAYIF
ncbi:MAG: hypothetical protein P4L55_22640 [Syntrophobacteraceae bacterium]|nr:hypothetical protein [Syntrophobacteraceae bacterium]